jgi:hypothetical protein
MHRGACGGSQPDRSVPKANDISYSFILSHAHTHTHTHARTHARKRHTLPSIPLAALQVGHWGELRPLPPGLDHDGVRGCVAPSMPTVVLLVPQLPVDETSPHGVEAAGLAQLPMGRLRASTECFELSAMRGSHASKQLSPKTLLVAPCRRTHHERRGEGVRCA